MLKKIFSGVQPTGNLHIGNYLGAIKNFVNFQNQDNTECIYCVVDLHAITSSQNPETLKNHIRETTAAFLASGLDYKIDKSIVGDELIYKKYNIDSIQFYESELYYSRYPKIQYEIYSNVKRRIINSIDSLKNSSQ